MGKFRALALAIAMALLAGCSADSVIFQSTFRGQQSKDWDFFGASAAPENTPIPPPPIGRRPFGWLSPRTRNSSSDPLLYAVDKSDSEILIYPESGSSQSPIGMISSGVSNPWGLYVDQNGYLYVANQGNLTNGTVTVYPPGSVYPSLTYSQDLSRPLYPIVDQHGDLFVGNDGPAGGTVVEYLAGNTSAYQVLQTGGTEVDGMDFDPQGNLYVAYRNGANGSILKFAPGTTTGQVLGMTIYQPQGIIVDKKGDILVAESKAETVVLFRPGAELPTGGAKLPPGSGNASQLALTAKQDELFAATEGGYIYTRTFPGTRASTWTVVDQGLTSLEGIALSNGQVF